MAISEGLYQELAKALARPSGAYRAARAGLQIPEQAMEGYTQGADFIDKIRQRKLGQQTLSEVLGGNVRGLEDFSSLPFNQVERVGKGVSGLADLVKARADAGSDYLTPVQAKEFGLSDSFINTFDGKPIKREVVQGFASNQTRKSIADSLNTRNQLGIANAINKNVNALTSGSGALALAGKNNLRIARVKSLLERPTPLTPAELELVTTDMAGVVQGGVPMRDTVEGQQVATVASKMANLLKQASNKPQTFNDGAFRQRIVQLANEMVAADNEIQRKSFEMVKANFGHLTTPEHLDRVYKAMQNGEQLPIVDVSGSGLSGVDEATLRSIAAQGD